MNMILPHWRLFVAKRQPQLDPINVPTEAGPHADRALIERCLAGEVTAWSELYQQCHEPLMGAIRRILRNLRADESVVEEIAARVWFSAVKDGGLLLQRFDPNRNCRLITFLSVVAQVEARAFMRSERRLRHRETEASHRMPREQSAETITSLDFVEQFLDKLTPRERSFFDQELLGQEGSEMFSAANSWQLRHRVHRKLNAFFQVVQD